MEGTCCSLNRARSLNYRLVTSMVLSSPLRSISLLYGDRSRPAMGRSFTTNSKLWRPPVIHSLRKPSGFSWRPSSAR